jgi:hypothetical protein
LRGQLRQLQIPGLDPGWEMVCPAPIGSAESRTPDGGRSRGRRDGAEPGLLPANPIPNPFRFEFGHQPVAVAVVPISLTPGFERHSRTVSRRR